MTTQGEELSKQVCSLPRGSWYIAPTFMLLQVEGLEQESVEIATQLVVSEQRCEALLEADRESQARYEEQKVAWAYPVPWEMAHVFTCFM